MPKSKPVDIDEFFAALPTLRVPGKLDVWLRADSERAKLFWQIMELAHDQGRVSAALKLWNQRFDPCPVRSNRVRVRLNERKQSR